MMMLYLNLLNKVLKQRSGNADRDDDDDEEKLHAPLPTQQSVGSVVSQELIDQLLSGEQILISRNFQIGHITQLFDLYSRMVEHFDQKNEMMRYYFVEKMQLMLSMPETIRLMGQDQSLRQQWEELQSAQRYTRLTSFQTLVHNEEERFNRPFLQSPKVGLPINKQQRVKQMKINIEVEENKHEVNRDLKVLVKEYEQLSKEFDHQIKNQLNDQKDKLQMRRNLRRESRRASSAERKALEIVQIVQQQSKGSTISEKSHQSESGASEKSHHSDKIMEQLEESVNFMRASINRMSRLNRKREVFSAN